MGAEEDIGYLKAKAENTESHIKTLFEKHDDTLRAINEMHSLLKVHVSTSQQRRDDIEKEVTQMASDVKYCKAASDDYYGVKRVAFALAGAASLVFTAIWKIAEKVFL